MVWRARAASRCLRLRGARMSWQTLPRTPQFELRRGGRCLGAELLAPHEVPSRSAFFFQAEDGIRYLLNHQSCEGSGHHERFQLIVERGNEAYHARACADAGVPPDATAMMGTAANMNYAAVVRQADG